MTHTIEKIAVLGSGVMGSGIAAQIANAGLDVVLLDIVPDGAEDRSILARSAVQRMHKTAPAPLMLPSNAKRITIGNLDDDLELLKECDWIIEVVLENLDIKHQTYKKINPFRKEGSILSSNTSTIPLEKLSEPFDDGFKKHFLITHFFNPPRYLRLLELVTSEHTDPAITQTIQNICDQRLGKGIVPCNDRPGFIANRIGTFWMQAGLNVAFERKTPITIADTVMGKPMGIPKTAIFGLIDLVGVDLIPKLAESLLSTLPETDQFHKIHQDFSLIHDMIEAGYTGRKGKGGFYRMLKDGKKRTLLGLDLSQGTFNEETAYAPVEKPNLESIKAAKQGLKAVLTHDDEGGKYAWDVMSQTLAYAVSLVPEIAGSIEHVDEAMRLGYNWAMGPFEMIDALGPQWFAERLKEDGHAIPALLSQVGAQTFYRTENGKAQAFGVDGTYHDIQRPEGVLSLKDVKLSQDPVFKTASASLWDIGDNVLCFEFTGKMNAIDEGVFETVHKAIEIIEGGNDFSALVLYSDAALFSAGANLALALDAMENGKDEVIPHLVKAGQEAVMALKFANFPVIAAPSGLALGGGCEFLLHSDHIQAHAELYCGLVEVGVGLIPGWGGCKEMLLRYQAREQAMGQKMWFSPENSPMGAVLQAFQTIGLAKTATSAADAMKIGYLKPSDGITMNRDRLLYDAKQAAIKLRQGYTPPQMHDDIRLPGGTGAYALEMAVNDMHTGGKATDYDLVVSSAVGRVLSGGEKGDWTQPMNEQDILDLEYQEFVTLVQNDGTKARVEHMLKTGKPLRN